MVAKLHHENFFHRNSFNLLLLYKITIHDIIYDEKVFHQRPNLRSQRKKIRFQAKITKSLKKERLKAYKNNRKEMQQNARTLL